MNTKTITEESMKRFQQFMVDDEKSSATIQKYMHDLKIFANFAKNKPVNKTLTLAYKNDLEGKYAVSSANSMLAAMNAYLRYENLYDCCVKQFKMQKKLTVLKMRS